MALLDGVLMTRDEAVAKLSALGCELAEPQSVEEKAARRAATVYKPLVFNPMGQCFRKVKYWSKDAAVNKIRRLGKIYLNAYQCVHCHAWHIGNPPRG